VAFLIETILRHLVLWAGGVWGFAWLRYYY